jgi:hypothetical protein
VASRLYGHGVLFSTGCSGEPTCVELCPAHQALVYLIAQRDASPDLCVSSQGSKILGRSHRYILDHAVPDRAAPTAGRKSELGHCQIQTRTPRVKYGQYQMTEEERYQSAWRKRKLCERIDLWFGLVGFFAVFLPFLYFFQHMHFPVLFVVFGSVVIGVGLTSGFVHARLRCPRCNQLFSVRPPRERHIFYLPYCAHCGLPEGAKPGPSVDPRFVAAKSN